MTETMTEKRCNNGMCKNTLPPGYPWITCAACLKKHEESDLKDYTVCPKCDKRGLYDYGHVDGPRDNLFWVQVLCCKYCGYEDRWD